MDTNKKLVFTIEIEPPISKLFNPHLYARIIAFRALNWCKGVRVSGEGVEVKMEKEAKKLP